MSETTPLPGTTTPTELIGHDYGVGDRVILPNGKVGTIVETGWWTPRQPRPARWGEPEKPRRPDVPFVWVITPLDYWRCGGGQLKPDGTPCGELFQRTTLRGLYWLHEIRRAGPRLYDKRHEQETPDD